MHTADLPTIGGYIGLQIDHHCLSNRLTDDEVSRIARIVKESLQLQQQQVFASFRGVYLQPGDVFQAPLPGLKPGPVGEESPFVITEVNYQFAKGDPERGHAAQYSQNHTFTAVALTDPEGKEITYRAPIWIKADSDLDGFKREYPHYDYQGVLSGCYGLANGEVVIPDPLGNIPVKFPYNYTEVCGNVPARYTRVISLSNQGGKTGRSFPVYKDTELQLVFANANMDFPLIKGAAANADTGHLHNSSVQNRTQYLLPQGQYLTYSNVPGDQNFVTMGATHSEGTQRSFMMLSNYQDPANPGVKKLDYHVATTLV